MNRKRVAEIEEKLADLKGRWPFHSPSPSLWQELEALEEELEAARNAPENGPDE